MNEGVYIAGPYCFKENGYEAWWSDRKLIESKGLSVYVPTATDLKLNNQDKRKNADEIFADLMVQLEKTTCIIADLDNFRGPECDGGTIFELGMCYGKGARLYGHTKSLVPIIAKNPYIKYSKDGELLDELGYCYPYRTLPFSPNIVASTTLIEGKFENALDRYLSDLRDERMVGRSSEKDVYDQVEVELDSVFISSHIRYSSKYEELKKDITKRLSMLGLKAIFPPATLGFSDPYKDAYECFKETVSLIDSSELFVADLSDFRGYEPSSDVAFECGYAFSKGKKLKGFMPDISIMRERIPNKDGVDANGMIVENFDYPINLMFACCMDIYKATIADFDLKLEKI